MAPACLIHVFSWHATYQKLFPKYRIYWRPRRPNLKPQKKLKLKKVKKKIMKKTATFFVIFFIFAFAVF